MATVSAPDAVGAVLQLVATLPPDERDVGRMRLAAVLRGVIAQRLTPREAGEGRRPVVEWLEVTDQFRTALASGADPSALRKAMDKAIKEGRAETFARGSRYPAP
jgi:twitching motility protein PilT